MTPESTYSYNRTASVTKPLYGHTDPNNAYMVDDYPYGFKARTRIRYWLESGGSKGFRFVSQTEDPKKLRWNSPKKSTYARYAACMYLDEKGHVQWRGISEYDSGDQVLDFIKSFPHADFSLLRTWIKMKVRYYELYLAGKVEHRMNGVLQPLSEEDMGRARKEKESWDEAARYVH